MKFNDIPQDKQQAVLNVTHNFSMTIDSDVGDCIDSQPDWPTAQQLIKDNMNSIIAECSEVIETLCD